jgi:hypothetical protein
MAEWINKNGQVREQTKLQTNYKENNLDFEKITVHRVLNDIMVSHDPDPSVDKQFDNRFNIYSFSSFNVPGNKL